MTAPRIKRTVSMPPRSRCVAAGARRRGLTMVETVTSIVIVGGMLVAALNTLAGAATARESRMNRAKAEMLAHDLMGEILAALYEESEIKVDQELTKFDGSIVTQMAPATSVLPVFGPETGENGGTRIEFDDVDDYDQFTEIPPASKDGTPLPGYEGWTRRAYVWFADPATASAAGRSTETNVKRIQVSVDAPCCGEIATVTALRSRASGYDSPPTVTQELINWVGVELQPTGTDTAVYAGSASVNQMTE